MRLRVLWRSPMACAPRQTGGPPAARIIVRSLAVRLRQWSGVSLPMCIPWRLQQGPLRLTMPARRICRGLRPGRIPARALARILRQNVAANRSVARV